MEMQMQLPREGVEALSVARPAVDEPRVLHGQPRPAALPAQRLLALRPELLQHTGLLVLPVISALETRRKSWCFREGLSSASRLRQLHGLVRCSIPAVRAPRGPAWAPAYLRLKWWGNVLSFSMHPERAWVLPERVCGAGRWRRGRKGGCPPVLPAPCWLSRARRESAEQGPGTADPVCRSMMIGLGSPCLSLLQPQSRGGVRVLNRSLPVSHASECPRQVPFCGGGPHASSTCTCKEESGSRHQPKSPSTS